MLRPCGVLSIIEHDPLNPARRIIVSRTIVDADEILLSRSESRSLLVKQRLSIGGCC